MFSVQGWFNLIGSDNTQLVENVITSFHNDCTKEYFIAKKCKPHVSPQLHSEYCKYFSIFVSARALEVSRAATRDEHFNIFFCVWVFFFVLFFFLFYFAKCHRWRLKWNSCLCDNTSGHLVFVRLFCFGFLCIFIKTLLGATKIKPPTKETYHDISGMFWRY